MPGCGEVARTAESDSGEGRIFAERERKVPALEDYSEEALLAEVGQPELGNRLVNPETGVAYTDMVQAGNRPVKRRSFRDVVCDEIDRPAIKGLVDKALTPGNVAAIISFLAPRLGISVAVVVTAGIMAPASFC